MFILILQKPGQEEKVLWNGTKEECEKKKLEFSFTYNTDFLIIKEKEDNNKWTISGILGFILFCGLTYLKYGRKLCITCSNK